MSDVVVAVQSCNRPWMLRLCLDRLARQRMSGASMEVQIWDDASEEPHRQQIAALWNEYGYPLFQPPAMPAATRKDQADARCGRQRQKIVADFLERSDAPYLMLLDDDVVLGPYTMRTLLDDFRMIRSKGEPIGALAVHGGHTVHREFVLGRTLFCHLNLTGEAAVLLSRECLVAVGNHFGPHRTGYADTQWQAMRDQHWRYMTRVNPPYEAQHLGIGDGSVIQHGKPDMFWLRDCWRANTPGKPYLEVPGLDVAAFVMAVKKNGCRAACMALARPEMTQARGTMNNQIRMPVETIRVYGELQLRVLQAGTSNVVRECLWRNVILDHALDQFVHLLAGDSQSSRKISQMQWGSGTTEADPSDTGLQIPLTPAKDISAITYPTARSVKFTAFIDADELNGFPITEAALLFADGSAGTRRTFPVQNKSQDFTFEFNWTLAFQAS